MKKIKFLDLKKINNEILNKHLGKIKKTLISGIYTNSNEVKKFEKKYKKYENFNYCLAVNSGTSALHLAIESLKIRKNSYIITPSHTFLATIAAIEYSGHKPLFIDINKNTLNLDIQQLNKETIKKAKAVIAVDMHGNKCDIEKIYQICSKHNLPLIQDSSQSHGTTIKIKKPKKFIKCQSFYPTKNLGGISEGGCIFTNEKILYKRMHAMRDWGKINNLMLEKGFNYRMPEINAIFLNLKLRSLKKLNLKRLNIVKTYYKEFYELIHNKFIKIQESNKNNNVYQHFIIRVNRHIRNKLISHLNKKNIQVMQHYVRPTHKEKYYENMFKTKNLKLIETEKLYSEMISLPCDPSKSYKEIKHIAYIVKKFIKNHANKKL